MYCHLTIQSGGSEGRVAVSQDKISNTDIKWEGGRNQSIFRAPATTDVHARILCRCVDSVHHF